MTVTQTVSSENNANLIHMPLGLTDGAVACIATGVAAILILAGVATWYCGRHSSRNSNNDDSSDSLKDGERALFSRNFVARQPYQC